MTSNTPSVQSDLKPESSEAFALRMLVAGGLVSQEKVDEALRVAAKFRAHDTASAEATEEAKPVAWVRYRSDGGFEGPIMDSDSRMCDTRRSFWTPLYRRAAAPQSGLTDERIVSIGRRHFREGHKPDAVKNFVAAVRDVLAEQSAVSRAPFQARVQPWMLECFGAEIAADTLERNHRFFEEAGELVQACGMTREEAHALVDYTWSRPTGERFQEVGGVMVTLAALCLANGLDMHAAGEAELARISVPETVAKIRTKQAAKPKHSPLPMAADPEVEQSFVRRWTQAIHDLPRASEQADEAVTLPRVHGVSRIADNPCALMLLLMREPSDDDLRAIHDAISARAKDSQ